MIWNHIIVLSSPQHIFEFSRHHDGSKIERKIINRMMIRAYLYINDLFIYLLKSKSYFFLGIGKSFWIKMNLKSFITFLKDICENISQFFNYKYDC